MRLTMSKPCILLVDDDDDILFALKLLLEQNGYRVLEANSPAQCLQTLERVTPNLILLDMNFSRDTTSGQEGLDLLPHLTARNIPTILMTAWANIELAVKGIKLGAHDFIEKPWRKDKLLAQVAHHCLTTPEPISDLSWIALSPAMQALDKLIAQVARTDANLLILGENGTGKSLLAKRIHQLSLRNSAPLVSLNMAAIADNLFESELFGHYKGAFTDAKQDRLGAFSQADKGTLFMDEIGCLPLHLQPKLLQVLETGEFAPLGANQSHRVNVRLIAATNHDLPKAITEQTFRQDLYYRLNTFVLTLPALRERQDDILPLAQHFIALFNKKYQKCVQGLASQAKQKLLAHTWPGNVRELSHAIERAVLISTHHEIDSDELLIDLLPTTERVTTIPALTLEALEKQRILDVLSAHHGQLNACAKTLGISRHALYRRLEKYQIDVTSEQ